MSALWRNDGCAPGTGDPASDERVLHPLTAAQLDAVMAIETAAYAFPWSRGNFVDSLAAGHPAWRLAGPADVLLGYCVAMFGVDELHLLNITVAPGARRRGHARFLIDALIRLAVEHRARQVWLEVRQGNAPARTVYQRLGFVDVGVRRGYYPAAFGRREDAVVMSLQIDNATQEAVDALA